MKKRTAQDIVSDINESVRIANASGERDRRAGLYPEMLAELKELSQYLYGLAEHLTAERYQTAKVFYLKGFALIAKCEKEAKP